MTRPIVELCEHGKWETHLFPDWDGPNEWPVARCPGGRVLEQAIIIERDTDGKWPVWAYQAMDRAEKAAYEKSNRAFLYEYLDALASAQESQT